MSIKWNTLKSAEDLELEKIEQAANSVRLERDRLLRGTDKYLLPDFPNKPQGVTEYRQALRDITNQESFPYNIVWPVL